MPGAAEERDRRRLAALWQERLGRQAGGVISVSPGAIGGFGANHHLRQSLVFLNMPAMQQPEAYIGDADKLFDADGKLTNDSTRDFLQRSCSPSPSGSRRTASLERKGESHCHLGGFHHGPLCSARSPYDYSALEPHISAKIVEVLNDDIAFN